MYADPAGGLSIKELDQVSNPVGDVPERTALHAHPEASVGVQLVAL